MVWIIVIFYQLFGLSFWRHPFTAEHPLLRQTTHPDLDGLRVNTFSANFHFWANYSLKSIGKIQIQSDWDCCFQTHVAAHACSYGQFGHMNLSNDRVNVCTCDRCWDQTHMRLNSRILDMSDGQSSLRLTAGTEILQQIMNHIRRRVHTAAQSACHSYFIVHRVQLFTGVMTAFYNWKVVCCSVMCLVSCFELHCMFRCDSYIAYTFKRLISVCRINEQHHKSLTCWYDLGCHEQFPMEACVYHGIKKIDF